MTEKLIPKNDRDKVAQKANSARPVPPRPAKNESTPQPNIQDTLPQSEEAERGVLSSMLNDAGCIPKVYSEVNGYYFCNPINRSLYEQLISLWREDQPTDFITLTQVLRDSGLLEKAGGAFNVTDLFSFVTSSANVRYYIDILREKFLLREMISAGTHLVRAAHGKGDVDISAMLDDFGQKLERMKRAAGGVNGTRISFRSPPEILEMPRNPKANFFGDRLLGVGRSLVLAGIGGLGKSRLLLQLLFALILERVWCGIEIHHTKGQPWMLVQTQNSIDRLQDDLAPLKHYAGDDWPIVEKNLLIHTLETDRDLMLHLSDPKNARDLERAIRDYNPIGVAFDPLNEIAIGDLSKDVEMTATCNAIGHISRAGNPDRAIIVLTHAITGLAGMKKAFSFEAAGFGRGSKVLQFWTRAQINIIPGKEDHSVLVLSCGKLNDGKMFSPFAVRLPDTMIYEVDPDFDVAALREQIESGPKKRSAYDPKIVAEMEWPEPEGGGPRGQLDKKQLTDAVQEETECSRATAYRLIEAARIHRFIKYSKQTKIYAKK